MTMHTSGPTTAELMSDLQRLLPEVPWVMVDGDEPAQMAVGTVHPHPAGDDVSVEWSAVIHEREPGVLLTAKVGDAEYSNATGGAGVELALAEVREAAVTAAVAVGAMGVGELQDGRRAAARARGLRGELTDAQLELARLRREVRRYGRTQRGIVRTVTIGPAR